MEKKKVRKQFAFRIGKAFRNLVMIGCAMGMLATSVGMSVSATGTVTATEMKNEKKTEKKVEIGKKTSASAYITAKDWPKGPSVESGGAVLMEAETGTVLYAKNPDTLFYPASITKIMTALLTLENSKLTDTVTFTKEALDDVPPGYVMIPVLDGEKMSVNDALHVLLLYSSNDIANGLAISHSGSIKEFSKVMNERAAQAGAKNTHFSNPSGLHETTHYTTPYDMCRIMRECIKWDAFNEIGGERIYTLNKNNKRKKAFTFAAKHKMLFPSSEYYYKYMVSGKTGYTSQANNTLITYAEKDGMKLICCTMKGGHGVAYKDTKALFEYGFDHFKVVDASSSDKRFTLKDAGIFASGDSPLADSFQIEIPEGSKVVLPSGVGLNKVDTDIRYLKKAEDGCFAEVDYQYEGMLVGTARLKMISHLKDESDAFHFESSQETETAQEHSKDALQDIWNRTRNIDVRIVLAVAVLVVALIVYIVIKTIRRRDGRIHFNRKRKR